MSYFLRYNMYSRHYNSHQKPQPLYNLPGSAKHPAGHTGNCHFDRTGWRNGSSLPTTLGVGLLEFENWDGFNLVIARLGFVCLFTVATPNIQRLILHLPFIVIWSRLVWDMPSKNDTEALYAQVQRRLVESGEWDRWAPFRCFCCSHSRILTNAIFDIESIQLILMNKLNESGWTDDLRHTSKGTVISIVFVSLLTSMWLPRTENARSMEPLSFRVLLEELAPHVQSTERHYLFSFPVVDVPAHTSPNTISQPQDQYHLLLVKKWWPLYDSTLRSSLSNSLPVPFVNNHV